MTLAELATSVSRELTASCVLPVSVPIKEIERIALQQQKWFYENYEEAVEDKWIIIKLEEFHKSGWKQKREFKMCDDVVAMTDAPREIKGGSLMFTLDRDISADRLWASEIYLSPMNGDQLVMQVAQMHFWDLTKAMTVDSLAFSYSNRTKILKIIGRDPRYDVIIRYAAKIPEEDLYEDFYFQRWVAAKAKLSLATILGTYQFNLMGGVSINFSDIREQGKDEITEIKEEINGHQSADFFMTFHS